MNKKLVATMIALSIAGGVSAANAADCGEVTIASMNWQSAEVAAELDKYVLAEGYGCDASVVVGDTVPTITSMAEKGQPDIAPETWIDMLPEVVKNEVAKGNLVQAATILSDGGVNGWWIPKYIADAHPDIKSIPDVLKHPELFPSPENPSQGAVFNGAQGWAGTIATAQLFKAYGGEEAGFELIDTGSAAGLDGSLINAYERKIGWVGFYWAPTALLGKYPMVKLDHAAPHDSMAWKTCITVSTCPNPKPNDWSTDHVYTVVSKRFSDRTSPEVMEYLNKRSWNTETISKLMAWMTDNQATGEEGAKYFLKENEQLWIKWVTPEAAENIKASL